MKLSLTLLATASYCAPERKKYQEFTNGRASAFIVTGNKVARGADEIGERSRTQFNQILRRYDSYFNVNKNLAYGCHCNYYGEI